MKEIQDVGVAAGAFSSIVFTLAAFFSGITAFLIPLILFLCSIFVMAVYSFRNRVHICDVCGEKLEPLPMQYKKHEHRIKKQAKRR